MRNILQILIEYRRSILIGIVLGILVALVFAGGFITRDLIGPAFRPVYAQSEDPNGYPLLDEVQALLDAHYLREQPSAREREYAAIRGMLSTLGDRYTFFIDPPVAQSESDVLAGTYGGIGVLIQRNEAGVIVLYPFPDGPAAEAGIEDDDILLEINGEPVDLSLSQDQIDQMLRGEVKEGNGVDLVIQKADTGETIEVFVPFAVINVPSVVWRTVSEDERLGYLQILRFTSRTPEEVVQALGELKAANIQALIVDLRDNSGGLLQESIRVADEFIDSGVLVIEADSDGETRFEAQPGGAASDLPLAILVNQGTASGAELVAGALQDYERGPVIGQRTYGKGTIQQIFSLSDGSSLHVTSAEWFTPSGRALSDGGLEPDVPMIPDENGRDVEMGEAIRRLQQILDEQEA